MVATKVSINRWIKVWYVYTVEYSVQFCRPDATILVFLMLSFKLTFSLSSFTFIKSLFSSSLSAIGWCHLRIWGYWYFSTILIPACASSHPVFLIMYSAYKLNKHRDSIQPWRTPLRIWNQFCSMFSSNCCFLTCIQISQEAGQVVWYPHLLRIFHSLLWSTQSKALA